MLDLEGKRASTFQVNSIKVSMQSANRMNAIFVNRNTMTTIFALLFYHFSNGNLYNTQTI